jgi:hypothetical protein
MNCKHISIALVLQLAMGLFILPHSGEAQATKTKSKKTPAGGSSSTTSQKTAQPSAGSKTNFTLDVDQNYCDVSLPYSYKSAPGNLDLRVGSSGDWYNMLGQDWHSTLPDMTSPPQDPSKKAIIFIAKGFSLEFDGNAKSYGTGNPLDPPTSDGHLNDDGQPLLGNPAKEFTAATFDAQRLLVRTVFGPNPFQVACAYPYLKFPTADGTYQQLHSGPDGKPISLLNKGAGFQLALNGTDAPKYYLINVVRWQDAPAPKGNGANVPFYQASTDNWYLLNYSDDQDRHQDFTKMFRKITPDMVSETLRIIGDKKVVFLGIHLAPLPVLGPSGVSNQNTTFGAATEQAWFDAVSVKYTFQASAATSIPMQDLGTLAQILTGDATSALGGLIPAAKTVNPSNFTALFADLVSPSNVTVTSELTKLESAVKNFNTAVDLSKFSDLDQFLYQLDPDALVGPLVIGANSAPQKLLNWAPPVSPSSKKTLSIDATVKANVLSAGDSDGATIQAIDNTIASIRNAQAILSAKPTLSTYQGRYAAGLITNLTSLPATLTGSWTATFATTPAATTWAGNAGVYDLTAPLPTVPTGASDPADKSNRSGVEQQAATANPNNTPTASSPVCNVSLVADGNSQAACSDQGAKVRDEGRSHWDVSVVIPITGYQDLTFQPGTTATGSSGSTPTLVTAKSITRENAYGVFDLFPVAEDLVDPPYLGIPHIVVGLPFAGKTFDKPYFAVGETINFSKAFGSSKWLSSLPVIGNLAKQNFPLSLRPTFGWVYNKVFPAATATNPQPYRSLKPQWGIEVSFGSVSGAVKTFSKNSGSGSTPNTTTPSTVPGTN